MGRADVVTDFFCRPVLHVFSPTLRGHVHSGILQSAQYVVASVWEKLQEALLEAPGMPILVTGRNSKLILISRFPRHLLPSGSIVVTLCEHDCL